MNALDRSLGQNPCSIEDIARELELLSEGAFDDFPRVLNVIRSLRVKPDSLERFLSWDKQHYTRNLIHQMPLFALMAICWEPGQGSSIHNHSGQNCWMLAPARRLRIQNYRVIFENVDEGKCELEPSDMAEMNANEPAAVDPLNPVHRVYNPIESNQRAVSLHIYSRPFDECVAYSLERGTCGAAHMPVKL